MPRRPEASELHLMALFDARDELTRLLSQSKEVPLGRVDDIALRHGVKATELLQTVSLMGDCEVDVNAGVVRCH